MQNESNTSFTSAFSQSFLQLETSLEHHFPENIFGDLDLLAASLFKQALNTKNPAKQIINSCQQISELFAQFGRNSMIQFRYAHDFLYGFDWSRWVRKDPDQRRHIGPFDPMFFQYLSSRGKQIRKLILRNSSNYPRLPKGQKRNPFKFSRIPDNEQLLHKTLVNENLIPVSSWEINGKICHEFDYHEIRTKKAIQLEISKSNLE